MENDKTKSWKGLEMLVITIEDFLEEIIEDNSYRNAWLLNHDWNYESEDLLTKSWIKTYYQY
jgi:hypothetical protein